MFSKQDRVIYWRNEAIKYRKGCVAIFLSTQDSLEIAARCELTADAVENDQEIPLFNGYY
jgi:hypothetical protein